MGIYIYIYLYENIRGCVSAKRLQISKNAGNRCLIFLDYLSFFVTGSPPYLLQGGRKTAFVEIIYTRSRLRERQTAENIEKQKTRVQYFWVIYLFCNRVTSVSPTGWPQNVICHTQKKTKKIKKMKKKKNTGIFFLNFLSISKKKRHHYTLT